MKIIQDGGGFSTEELQGYKYIVYGNCVTQMKVIINAAEKLNIPFSSEDNRVILFLIFDLMNFRSELKGFQKCPLEEMHGLLSWVKILNSYGWYPILISSCPYRL
jgi:hypothetical protein